MNRTLIRPVSVLPWQAPLGASSGQETTEAADNQSTRHRLDPAILAATLDQALQAGALGLDAARLGLEDLAVLGRALAAMPQTGKGAAWEMHLGISPDGASGTAGGKGAAQGKGKALDWTSHMAVVRALEDRFNALGRARIHGLTFLAAPGSPDDRNPLAAPNPLDAWDKGLGRTAQGLMATGLVKRIGLAVDTPEQARRALDLDGPGFAPPNLLRIRAGVLDHAMEEAGIPALARERGVQLMVEDVFCSGLLLCAPGRPGLGMAGELLALLDHEAEALELERVSLVLGYLAQAMPGAALSVEIPGPELLRHVAEARQGSLPPQLADRVRRTLRSGGGAVAVEDNGSKGGFGGGSGNGFGRTQ